MKKVIRKYLFTLLILLLNGYSFLNANPAWSRIYCASVVFINSEFAKLTCREHSSIPTVGSTPTNRNEKYKNYSEEKEVESYRPFFTRTYILAGSYFAVFYKKISHHIFYDIKRRLYLDAHWFYSSSHRNIILKVIRI